VFQRERARHYAQVHGESSCLSLVDPAIYPNAHRTELALLAKADLEGAAYFRSHPVLITELDPGAFVPCFGEALSDTPVDTKAIFLNLGVLTTPELRAAALSHELIHVEHGDFNSRPGRHSLLHHLWISEEGEAHQRGARTAARLGLRASIGEFIMYAYALPLSYVVILLLFCLGLWSRSKYTNASSPAIGVVPSVP
jgi:hypothetical protein